MDILTIIIMLLAGWGAGVVTGLVGASAVVVVTPVLVSFLGYLAYPAIGISLATDVFASTFSARSYYHYHHIDIKHGAYLAVMAVIGALIGSFASSYMPDTLLGRGTGIIVLFLGIQFLRKPLNKRLEEFKGKHNLKFFKDHKICSSIIFGLIIGLICGVVGAGGGVIILMILTFVLGYDIKTAIGTSVLIMACTALSGAAGHFIHSGIPYIEIMICGSGAIIGAIMASKFANIASEEKLSKTIGIVFIILGIIMTAKRFFG